MSEQPSATPTALELFKKFQLKFREVELEPCGFPKHEDTSEFAFLVKPRGHFTYYEPCSIHLSVNELAFSFIYDPHAKGGAIRQMGLAAWDAILKGPFQNRHFYADPDWTRLSKVPFDSVPIQLSHDGDPILGLHLPRNMKAKALGFFIPDASLESAAIRAAIALERASVEAGKLHQEESSIPRLKERLLEAALAAAGD